MLGSPIADQNGKGFEKYMNFVLSQPRKDRVDYWKTVAERWFIKNIIIKYLLLNVVLLISQLIEISIFSNEPNKFCRLIKEDKVRQIEKGSSDAKG